MLGVGLAMAWVLGATVLYVQQEQLLYQPDAQIARTPTQAGMSHRELTLTTDDGETLRGWWIPARAARGTLLFFHGNAGNRGDRVESVGFFRDLGMNVLIVDYRGYGGSTGTPAETGTYADARTTWDAAMARGATPETTVIYGRSMGGAIAAYLATERIAAGLILDSTFTSIPDLAQELYPLFAFDFLIRNKYPTRDHLERSTVPTLLLHSPHDTLIPFHHGQSLRDVAGPRGTFAPLRGDHNASAVTRGPGYRAAVLAFLGDVVG